MSDATNGLLMANGYAADKNNPFDYLTGTSANTGIKVESNALSMVVDYDFDSGSLKSITAYDEFENSETIDADRTQLDIITFYEKRSGENFSQEIRFTSNSDQALEYQQPQPIQVGLLWLRICLPYCKHQRIPPHVEVGLDAISTDDPHTMCQLSLYQLKTH